MAFEAQNTQLYVEGYYLRGVARVRYGSESAGQFVYGRGEKPVAWAQGEPSHSGSLLLDEAALASLREVIGEPAKAGPFRIAVHLGPPDEAGSTDLLRNCLVRELKRDSGQEAGLTELPLQIGEIVWG